MKNTTFLQHRRLLARAEADARESLAHRRSGINIEMHGDPIDNLTEGLDREQSITASMLASKILRNVRAAYARMEAGTYGECVQCGEAISEKRLTAIPWTPNCLSCQERIDEQDAETDDLSAA